MCVNLGYKKTNLCSLSSVSFAVSFYGASHIAMPLQEAKISTNIRLRFRSRQDNALLLLTAGRTDYSLLSIDGGRIRFSFKIDEYHTDVSIWVIAVDCHYRGLIWVSAMVTGDAEVQRSTVARHLDIEVRSEFNHAD